MTALTLSAKETEMLVAVMSEMGEIPNTINFDRVATRVDVKYGKNARQSFKKLFEKLKAQAGPSPEGQDGATPPKTPSPTKRASPKKKVGVNNTPIKATPKPRGKKAAVKKVKEEDFDSDEPMEERILGTDGKSSDRSFSSLTTKEAGNDTDRISPSTGSSESVQTPDEYGNISFAGENEVDDESVAPDEQLLADEYGMTIQAYREWRGLNTYDNFLDDM